MTSFLIARLAYADLEDVDAYTLERWGEEQRQLYISGLFEMFASIASNPGLGRARPELGEGVMSLPHQRHIIFYESYQSRCHILRVLHAARDPLRQFNP